MSTHCILGLDPGTVETGYAFLEGDPSMPNDYRVAAAGKVPNEEIIPLMDTEGLDGVVVETLQSYGRPFGQELIETCYWLGEFRRKAKDAGLPFFGYPRPLYGKAICGSNKVSDPMIRQALMLRFGGDKKGQPTYLLRGDSDRKSAFAVAAYHVDQQG